MSRRAINFGSDEDFIANYEKLKSSRKMGELYGCNKTSVLTHAKKIGYDVNSNKEYKLSQEDKEYIKQHYNDMTSNELAEKFNVSRGMITKVWYDAKLKGKETITHSPKFDLTGLKVGLLTVIRPTEERDASGSIKWLCQCECGNTTLVGSSRLKQGLAKSCGCLSKKSLKIGQGLNFQDLTGQHFGKLTVLKRCENNNDRVQWLCKCSCGRETKVLADNLKKGNTQSCGMCGNNSHGNIKIDEILTKANIPFEREKRFPTCKDKSMLPFDFYVNNLYLIEYDGKQHYEETNTIFNYEQTHKHDLIKSKWCKDNNIPLIRIPYTHYNNLCLTDLILATSPFVEK